MNTEEAKSLGKYVASLWPGKVSPEMGTVLSKALLPFAAKPAKGVISGYRLSNDKPSLPGILDALRAADRKATSHPAEREEASWCDIQRARAPHLREAGDAEVILRVYRQWWHQREKWSNGYQAKFTRECATLLFQSHNLPDKTPDEEVRRVEEWAARLAQEIFEPSPEHFRRVLADLRYATADTAADPFA